MSTLECHPHSNAINTIVWPVVAGGIARALDAEHRGLIVFGIAMMVVVLSRSHCCSDLFVSLPVAVMTFYAMYRDIFIGE